MLKALSFATFSIILAALQPLVAIEISAVASLDHALRLPRAGLNRRHSTEQLVRCYGCAETGATHSATASVIPAPDRRRDDDCGHRVGPLAVDLRMWSASVPLAERPEVPPFSAAIFPSGTRRPPSRAPPHA
jgi:hypothetical protein